MLKAAVREPLIATNPCEGVRLPPERAGEQRFLNVQEVTRLSNAIKPRFRCLVLLASYGGLRFGEIAGLRRKRIDTLRGGVTVAETLIDVEGKLEFAPPKTRNSERYVPLPRSIANELSAHLSAYTQEGGDALVFTGPRGDG